MGAYALTARARSGGPPRPRAGPVLHARRRRRLGWAERRAPLPAARLLVRARARGGRRDRARLPARGGRARHGAAGRAAAGGGLGLLGPLGIGWDRIRRTPEARRPLLVGGGIGAAPLLCLQDELGEATRGAARLPLGRACRGGRACSAATRRSPPTTARSATQALVTELLRERARRRSRGDRLRLRAAADARGRARALRRARGPRPAGDGVRHGLRLRRLLRLRRADARTATCACASTGRCSTPTGSTRRWSPGPGTDAWTVDSRGRAAGPGPERLRAPSTRSPPGARSATRCSSSFPFDAFVSKTITLEPRQGNPPPRLWETPAGLINSIGLPNKGLDGLPRQRPPAARRAAGAARACR